LIWGVLFTLWSGIKIRKRQELGTFYKGLTTKQKQSFILWLFALGFIVFLFILGYGQTPIDLKIPWFIVAILDVRIFIYIFEVLSDVKAELKTMHASELKARKQSGEIFNKANFITQAIILMIFLPIMIHLLMGSDMFGQIVSLFGGTLDPMRSWTAMFNTCMILISVSGVIAVTQLQRSPDYSEDFDKTSLIGYIMMIALPILILIILPAQAENAMVAGSLIPGVVGKGGVDYFGTVYVAILDSGPVQVTLVLILISSLSLLIGKARGQQGGGNLVVGALGVAGVPMIVALMCFVGRIPPPPVFLTIFDEGFAQLIFAISYTSIISLALALVGVFWEFIPTSRGLDD